MTPDDLQWVRRLLRRGLLKGPVLELGVGYGGSTCRETIEEAGLRYHGSDLERAPLVEFTANFERAEDMAVFAPAAPFGTVLVLNVLEHTFDPIRILDNAISLLASGGSCAVLTPSIWPLHNYPMDTWRILPNFYEEYARRRGLALDTASFEYVGYGPVSDYHSADGSYCFPPPARGPAAQGWSRLVHRLFNTAGRAMFHPSHIATAALLVKN